MFAKRLLGVILLGAFSIVLAPGLGAQSSLDEARERASEAAARSDEARALADEAEQNLLDSVIAIESATGRLVGIEADLELLARRITTAQDELGLLFGDVQFLAVQSYINQEDIGVGFLVGNDITEGAEREVFIELISGISIDSIDRYRVVTQDLEIAQGAQTVLLETQNEVLGELSDENLVVEAALAQADSQLVEVEVQEAVFQAEVAKL
ncbi:MAG: hypothetical protein ACC652_07710, partial [Acidimicrobiales bacterium]